MKVSYSMIGKGRYRTSILNTKLTKPSCLYIPRYAFISLLIINIMLVRQKHRQSKISIRELSAFTFMDNNIVNQ